LLATFHPRRLHFAQYGQRFRRGSGNSLRQTLDTLAGTAKQVSESGNAVTMTHSQTTKIGRTEIKIGNTEEAKSGRMTSSQSGETNWTPYYIIGGLVAIVLIAFLFAGHH
jgi:hypothetical protein